MTRHEHVTLINMFTLNPDNVERFLHHWRQRAQFMSRQPGFRSFRLYRALQPDTQFQLVNIAEWDCAAELSAATAQPFFRDSVRRSLAESGAVGGPALYRLAVETNPSAPAKQYRVGAFVKFNNAVMRLMIRAGIRFGTFAVLTVPGRKSGRPIDTPLVVFPHDGGRYLVATYGKVNWVRNIRANDGRATLASQGRREDIVVATELPPEQAAPILQASLRNGPPGIPRPIVRAYRRFLVLPYLDVDTTSSLEDFEHSALGHPVFAVTTSPHT